MLKRVLFWIACAVLAGGAWADIYYTEFRSGLSLQSTYTQGDFSATISSSGTSLDVLGVDYDLEEDPVVRAIGNGTITLTFNQNISQISFDIGGLDASDSATFSITPVLSDSQNITQHFTGTPSLNGTIVQGTGTSGTRVTFSGLDTNSFSWTNTGTWIFYDNFEFQTVPEPASVALLGLISGAGLFIRRRLSV